MFEPVIFLMLGGALVASVIPAVICAGFALGLWYGKSYWAAEDTLNTSGSSWVRQSRAVQQLLDFLWPTTVQLPEALHATYTKKTGQPVVFAAHPHNICTSSFAAFLCCGQHPERHWLSAIVDDPTRGKVAVTRWLLCIPGLREVCRALHMFDASRENIKRALFDADPARRHSVLCYPGGVAEMFGEGELVRAGPYVKCREHSGLLQLLWNEREQHAVPMFLLYYRGEHRRAVISTPFPEFSRRFKTWFGGLPVGCFWRPRFQRTRVTAEVHGPLWAAHYATLDEFNAAYQQTITQACAHERAELKEKSG